MASASIILPQKLVVKLRDKAEESDSVPDELAIEIIFKGLGEELDPEDLVEQYQTLSEKYFNDGKELLKEGDLVKASEKLWGAAALTVKMVAAKRGLKLEQHGSMWAFVSEISREKKDRGIIRLFYSANALHRNFYENEMTEEMVGIAVEDVEKLITKLT